VIPRSIRKSICFHEAGHAAMHWFWGTAGDFCHIDMRPNSDFLASVRWRPVASEAEIGEMRSWPSAARGMATRCIMQLLGGPCAQNLECDRDEEWFELLMFNEWEPGPDQKSDIARAVRIALALTGEKGPEPGPRSRTFLAKISRWTDEAFGDPRLWGVVEALACRLQHVQSILDGDEAWEVMKRAWGGDPSWAALEMGRKWRRRLIGPNGSR